MCYGIVYNYNKWVLMSEKKICLTEKKRRTDKKQFQVPDLNLRGIYLKEFIIFRFQILRYYVTILQSNGLMN